MAGWIFSGEKGKKRKEKGENVSIWIQLNGTKQTV